MKYSQCFNYRNTQPFPNYLRSVAGRGVFTYTPAAVSHSLNVQLHPYIHQNSVNQLKIIETTSVHGARVRGVPLAET